MKCTKCNCEIDENVNFCSNCGEYLKPETTETTDEITVTSTTNLSNKIKTIPSKIKYLSVAIVILLLSFIVIGFSSSLSKTVVPYSSSVCLGKDKDTVLEEFKSAGFSNISLEAIEDLEISEENKYDSVDYISINDITDFDENSKFKNSTQIIIKYHTFKSAVIPFSSDEIKTKNTDEIISTLENIGFSKISVEEKYDLDPDKNTVKFENEISIDGTDDFETDDSFPINSEIKIVTHKPYNKYSLKLLIDFVPNLMLSTYDVSFDIGGHTETLIHGTDGDFEYRLKEGKYTLTFQSEEDSSIESTVEIDLTGDTEASYKINCHSDRISIETKYVENESAVGKGEAMVPSSAIDCKFENYKDITKIFKKAGFTNISTEVLYDIVWGWTEEGEVATISIDGKTDFQRGEIFEKDAEIVITYHMKEEDNPNKESTTEEVDDSEEDVDEEDSGSTENSSPTFYSTNDYKTATEGNTGIFAYKSKDGSYDVYWLIDFDDGYVYFFTEGNGETYCDKLKIVSGNLNNRVVITWYDGEDSADWYLHFNYAYNPVTLIVTDHFGISNEFSATDLNKALSIRRSRTIVEN